MTPHLPGALGWSRVTYQSTTGRAFLLNRIHKATNCSWVVQITFYSRFPLAKNENHQRCPVCVQRPPLDLLTTSWPSSK